MNTPDVKLKTRLFSRLGSFFGSDVGKALIGCLVGIIVTFTICGGDWIASKFPEIFFEESASFNKVFTDKFSLNPVENPRPGVDYLTIDNIKEVHIHCDKSLLRFEENRSHLSITRQDGETFTDNGSIDCGLIKTVIVRIEKTGYRVFYDDTLKIREPNEMLVLDLAAVIDNSRSRLNFDINHEDLWK